MKPIDAAWNLLKAIPLDPDTPSGFRGEVSDAHFRESLPNFPLGAHMQTMQQPDYREAAGYGEPAAVLGGERNMRTAPISPYDSDITRQSAYQFAPLRYPNVPGSRERTANYLGGVPKTHSPPSGSNQALIDAIERLDPDSPEYYIEDGARQIQGFRNTHPTQRHLDEMGMSRDEYLQYMQGMPTEMARQVGLDNNLPGGRLGMVARHSQDMTPPEYQQSVFE